MAPIVDDWQFQTPTAPTAVVLAKAATAPGPVLAGAVKGLPPPGTIPAQPTTLAAAEVPGASPQPPTKKAPLKVSNKPKPPAWYQPPQQPATLAPAVVPGACPQAPTKKHPCYKKPPQPHPKKDPPPIRIASSLDLESPPQENPG